MEERGWAYRRRQLEGKALYEAVRDNLATLLAVASEVGRGPPQYVKRDFASYLECGVLARGFARVRCESCKAPPPTLPKEVGSLPPALAPLPLEGSLRGLHPS